MPKVWPRQARRGHPGRFAQLLSARLRDLRWSHLDLAVASGLSRCRIGALLAQESISEEVFLRLADVLGLDLDIRQISRPLPPLTPYERLMAWRAIDACRAAGGADEALRLQEIINRRPSDIERDEFNTAMRTVQRVVVRAKVAKAGYDPDEVLGDDDY